MTDGREELVDNLREALADRSRSDKLSEATSRARASRNSAMEELHVDIQRMKELNRTIKTSAIKNPAIIDEFAENVRKNGGHVFFADTGKDAIEYISELSMRVNGKLIIKSKSLTSDEIDFNEEMGKRGIRSVETDLGELIVQLDHERAIHLVMPAAHKSAEDVARIFSKETGVEILPDDQAILSEVRKYLRPIFLSADIGVTGANIGIAETGSILIITNEGNARIVSSLPRVHIVLIGREKILPTWEDASNVASGLPISSTGQQITVYMSLISRHLPLAGSEDGREFHVIILDNGRTKMSKDRWAVEALNCIRCAACMNICPTYPEATGYVFGYIYPGPIGIPWTANVHGIDKATFADLCIACGLCKEICPVDIDMPMMIAKVKGDVSAENGQLLVNSFFMSSEALAKIASATAPISNWFIRSTLSRWLMEKAVGVDKRRTLPTFTRRRLRSRLEELGHGTGGSGKLVFFPDVYADYNDPDLGVRAIAILQSLGYDVEVPAALWWSGMPYLSYGDISKAEKTAKHNLDVLEPYVSKGYTIVSTEPTACYMLSQVYSKLVPGAAAENASKMSVPFFRFIQDKLPDLQIQPSESTQETLGFHIACHDRPLTSGSAARRFLERVGYDVQVVETGTCCGMGGTFGMKHGPLGYDLSMAVGERLFKLFRESGCKLIATESSVCAMQLADGLTARVVHPLKLATLSAHPV